MTRQEHLSWCKQRALEFVDAGDNVQALASMGSDLGKHVDTKGSADLITLGLHLLMAGHMRGVQEGRDFINGFN